MDRGFSQTVVKYKSWFPDEGSSELEIWRWVKEDEQATRWENIPNKFLALVDPH